MKFSYKEIANNAELWMEYVETNSDHNLEDYDNLSEPERIEIIESCFGKEKDN